MSSTNRTNEEMRYQRLIRGWSLQRVADELCALCIKQTGKRPGCNSNMIGEWERGVKTPGPFYQEKLCLLYGATAEQLGFVKSDNVNRRKAIQLLGATGITILATASGDLARGADDLLPIYARGIAACQDLYYDGSPQHVEALLPLYAHQITSIARQASPQQQSAARLASQAHQLTCELATDREDFATAQHAGQQALLYAQVAEDANLQVNALISLANLGWHLSSAQPDSIRKHSKAALQAYRRAISLFDSNVTPLLRGRAYAGIAEVYALRGQLQEAMQAMGQAYECFPMQPEQDPAYQYLRASRYSLYVFGDAQSRLLLSQPKEAEAALIAMQKETNDPKIEPITKLDLLYYQADVQIQQGELKHATAILTEAATLAKDLGSRLYFNKLASSYRQLQAQWPRESVIIALEEIFQPW